MAEIPPSHAEQIATELFEYGFLVKVADQRPMVIDIIDAGLHAALKERDVAQASIFQSQQRTLVELADENRELKRKLDIAVDWKAHAAALADRLTRYEWQPIETAPENERVLIYVPERQYYVHGVFTAVKVRRTGAWVLAQSSNYPPQPPTHWALCPDKPAILALPQDGEAL